MTRRGGGRENNREKIFSLRGCARMYGSHRLFFVRAWDGTAQKDRISRQPDRQRQADQDHWTWGCCSIGLVCSRVKWHQKK